MDMYVRVGSQQNQSIDRDKLSSVATVSRGAISHSSSDSSVYSSLDSIGSPSASSSVSSYLGRTTSFAGFTSIWSNRYFIVFSYGHTTVPPFWAISFISPYLASVRETIANQLHFVIATLPYPLPYLDIDGVIAVNVRVGLHSQLQHVRALRLGSRESDLHLNDKKNKLMLDLAGPN